MNSIIYGEANEPMTAQKAAKMVKNYSQENKLDSAMQEEYDKQEAKKTKEDKFKGLLTIILDAVYNSSYDDESKESVLGFLQRVQVPVVRKGTNKKEKIAIGNIVSEWFIEKGFNPQGIKVPYFIESPAACNNIAIPDQDDDQVNHPSHYQSYNTKLNIECIDAMRAAFGDEVVAHFCKCNAFKYTWRESSKGGNESISKAIWYLNKYLELDK